MPSLLEARNFSILVQMLALCCTFLHRTIGFHAFGIKILTAQCNSVFCMSIINPGAVPEPMQVSECCGKIGKYFPA